MLEKVFFFSSKENIYSDFKERKNFWNKVEKSNNFNIW